MTACNRLLSIFSLVIDQIRFLSYELIKLRDEMYNAIKGVSGTRKLLYNRFSFLVKPFVKVHVIFPSDGTEN